MINNTGQPHHAHSHPQFYKMGKVVGTTLNLILTVGRV